MGLLALECGQRWAPENAGRRTSAGAGKGARMGSLTLAFLLRWSLRGASADVGGEALAPNMLPHGMLFVRRLGKCTVAVKLAIRICRILLD